MRGTTLTLLSALWVAHGVAATGPQVLHRAACNADSCARLVTGTTGPATTIPSSVRRADCASFLDVTATPATSTVSTTIVTTPALSTVSTATTTIYTTTVLTTVTVNAASAAKRGITSGGVTYNSATALPPYVSTVCGTGTASLSRYSSACSCFGVRGSTTTIPTPVTTATIYFAAPTPLTTVTSTVSTDTTSTVTVTSTPTDSTCPTSTVYSNGPIQFRVVCDYAYVTSVDDTTTVSDVASLHDCLVSCDIANMHFGDECTAVNYYDQDVDGIPAGTCVYLPLDSLPLSGEVMAGVKAAKRLSFD